MFDIIPLATSRGHFFFSISLSAPAFGLLKNRWSKLTAVWKAPVQYETNSLSLKVWESLPIKFNTQTSLISDSSYALMIGVCPSLPLYPLPPPMKPPKIKCFGYQELWKALFVSIIPLSTVKCIYSSPPLSKGDKFQRPLKNAWNYSE